MTQFEAYQNALGIRTISFHRPNDEVSCQLSPLCPSQLLAVGSYDGHVRLLSTRSWKLAFDLPACHPAEMVEYMRGDVVMTVEVIENDTTETDLSISSDASLFSTK